MVELSFKGDKIYLDEIDSHLVKNGFYIYYKKGGNKYVGIGHHKTLHQVIMGKKYGFEIDHINGNGLDNRRSNLRFCTHHQNMMNRKLYKTNKSDIKGVSWCVRRNMWRSTTILNGKSYEKGFKDIKDAINYRIKMAALLFGKFNNK